MSDVIDLAPVVYSIERLADKLQHNIAVVNSNLAVVDEKVDAVTQLQNATQNRLEVLYQEFSEFVAADVKHKERQFAQTRLIEVRQELETRFGHYDEVRRTTTGILQATDAAIVREETMRFSVESMMLTVPGYWLAPALVALTAWFADKRALADKALAEAVRRDDSKTSLFFSLVCRRARRTPASSRWLVRYFQLQNPLAMEREVVLMLDALANGVFGGAALIECSRVIEQWLTELEQQAGFLDDQRKRWAEKLDVMAPHIGPDEYSTLRSCCQTWPRLEQTLSAARRNQIVYTFFDGLFAGEIVVPPSLEMAVDQLLDSLVTKFDEEELPTRRELRLLQLIVQEAGDRTAAKRLMDAESNSFEEKTHFAAMLTNSAMNPEQFGATRATQRYAVSRSREWVIAAHQDLIARDRARIPADLDLTCGSWKGKSRDGSEEEALNADLVSHYTARIQEAVAAVQLSPVAWIVLVVGVLLGVLFMSGGGGGILFGLIIAGAAGAYFYTQHTGLEKSREAVRQQLQTERDQASRMMKAALAEVVDLRREIAKEDGKADNVLELLQALSAPQFVLQRPEQARATVA